MPMPRSGPASVVYADVLVAFGPGVKERVTASVSVMGELPPSSP